MTDGARGRWNVAYRDPAAAARAWKAGGGRIVGYIGDAIPVELIVAAGFLPYRIDFGIDPVCRTSALLPPSAVPRPQRIAWILSALLEGAFDFLDYLVVPRSSQALSMLVPELRSREGTGLNDIFLLDRAWSTSPASMAFNRRQIACFAATLETWSHAAIDPAMLTIAGGEAAEGRNLLRQLHALRHGSTCPLSGGEMLEISVAAARMMPGAVNIMLSELLSELAGASPLSGVPVYLAGGEPVDDLAYRRVVAAGGNVVGESHGWGDRSLALAETSGDTTIGVLADRYARSPFAGMPTLADLEASEARRAIAYGSAAVVIANPPHDRAAAWQSPGLAEAFRNVGLPVHFLAHDTSHDEDTLSDFLAKVGGGPK